jgi:hypothetical protein
LVGAGFIDTRSKFASVEINCRIFGQEEAERWFYRVKLTITITSKPEDKRTASHLQVVVPKK